MYFLNIASASPRHFQLGLGQEILVVWPTNLHHVVQKNFNPMACMFGIIILLQTMAIRIMIPQKWKKTRFKYRYKVLSIHDSCKYYNISCSSFRYATPYVHLDRVLGSLLECAWLKMSAKTYPTVLFQLNS